jgi:hypothetical protein
MILLETMGQTNSAIKSSSSDISQASVSRLGTHENFNEEQSAVPVTTLTGTLLKTYFSKCGTTTTSNFYQGNGYSSQEMGTL